MKKFAVLICLLDARHQAGQGFLQQWAIRRIFTRPWERRQIAFRSNGCKLRFTVCLNKCSQFFAGLPVRDGRVNILFKILFKLHVPQTGLFSKWRIIIASNINGQRINLSRCRFLGLERPAA